MLTREQAEALTQRIRNNLVDLERLIDEAYEGQADVALGYDSWAAYCKARILLPQLNRIERRKIVKSLTKKEMTQREVAATLGIAQSTVAKDLRDQNRSGRSTRALVPLTTPVVQEVAAGTSYSSGRTLSTDQWDRAEQLILSGMGFTGTAKAFGVSESTIRRDMRMREAKARVDHNFDPIGSTRHPEMSVACEIEPATELINDIRRQADRVLSPVYTLSKHDRRKLTEIFTEGLKKLEEYSE